ncbi:MAG: aminotransferase class V-fold PLP-dependent enzyme, partial [Pseudomonadota bacterium]
MQLDTEFVRAQFPAFAEPSLRDLAFFENAGGTYACRYVIWRLNRFYKERKVQPHGPFQASDLAGREMDEARDRLARALGVLPEALCFGPSTSANSYVLSQAFRDWLPEGSAIIVTDQDHEANSGPWRRLASKGIEVREWKMQDNGHLDISDLVPLL